LSKYKQCITVKDRRLEALKGKEVKQARDIVGRYIVHRHLDRERRRQHPMLDQNNQGRAAQSSRKGYLWEPQRLERKPLVLITSQISTLMIIAASLAGGVVI